MRAVDTNIIVRYLTGDDPAEATKARRIIGQDSVFVSRTVLLETERVLRTVYGMPADQIIPAIRALAGLPGVSVEDATLVAKAVDWAESGMDFADALHLAAADGCGGFLTFDKRLASTGSRVGGVAVTVP